MKKSISILLICLIYSNTIVADELAGTFLRTSDQIQAINIGENLTAVASGAMAPHFNPAGLVQFTGKGFQAILNSASLDRKAHNLSAFLNLRGDVGFGFSWIHARVNDIRGRSGSGQFTGKIEEVIYHGDHTRVRLDLLGSSEFILKVPNSTSNLELKVKEDINIGWNSVDARALDPK